jgi:polar amino acid transport system substrate-binding protein
MTAPARGPRGGTSRRPGRVAAAAVPSLALALLGGACASTSIPESLPGPTTTTTAAPPPAPVPQDPACNDGNVTQSLRPDEAAEESLATRAFPSGSYMAEIRDRGRLRVGVDTSTILFSSVNPQTGLFEGFDVEIARELAAALLGSRDAIEFVAIPYSARVDVLADGVVDMVVDTFTINCVREDRIDFSTQYFTSSQKLLVRVDDPSTGIADFGDRRVCAAAGSTSADNLRALPEPRPRVVEVTDQADCLVLLQQGQVEGISTDDTILAGMQAQDPNVRIVGDAFSAEPYGIGLPPNRPEYVRFVNAALEQVRSSGRWTELYEQWLSGLPGSNQPPAAAYEDPLPIDRLSTGGT